MNPYTYIYVPEFYVCLIINKCMNMKIYTIITWNKNKPNINKYMNMSGLINKYMNMKIYSINTWNENKPRVIRARIWIISFGFLRRYDHLVLFAANWENSGYILLYIILLILYI